MGAKIEKWIILFFLLYPANVAFANPVFFDPITDVPYIMALGSAIAVEVCLTAIILLFFDMSPKPVFFALYAGNLAAYFAVFLPLLDALSSLLIVEAIIVAVDGALIKLISLHDTFHLDTFIKLKWKYAFIAAGIGNLVSYSVGAVIV